MFDAAFAVAVSTVAFVGFAYKPVKRALLGALDSRSDLIARELEEATRLREEAQALLASFQRKREDALAEAQQIVSDAKLASVKMTEQAQHDLEHALNQRISQAMNKIGQAEASALKDVQNNIVYIAMATAHSLLLEGISKDTADEVVNRAAQEIAKKLH
jgi:F-type H+-transporting ATPase subunit b